MFCKKCGSVIEEGARFCKKCGTPVQAVPSGNAQPPSGAANRAPQQPNRSVQPPNRSVQPNGSVPITGGSPPQPQGGKQKLPKPKKSGMSKLSKAACAVIPVLIIVLALLMLKLLPQSAAADTGKQVTTTHLAVFEKFEMEVSSNRPITSVSYALNPEDPQDDSVYQEAKSSSGVFKRTVSFDRLQVGTGENLLCIRIKSPFGFSYCNVKLNCDIGTPAEPQQDAFEPNGDGSYLVSNELIVEVKEGVSEDAVKALAEKYGAEVVGQNYIYREYQFRFGKKGRDFLDDVEKKLAAEDAVVQVQHNIAIDCMPDIYPNDTEYDSWKTAPGGNNWGLEAIHAPEAWDSANDLETVRVGVMDTFLQYDHPDLQIDIGHSNVLPTESFKSMTNIKDYYHENVNSHSHQDPSSCIFCRMKSHGTHVTGIAGARSNNNRGVAGVGWNTDMYFTTFWYLNRDGQAQMRCSSTLWTMEHNICWLAVNGCRAINMSIGDSQASDRTNITQEEREQTEEFDGKIQQLATAGYDFLICKAAGNENDDARNYQLNRIMTGGDTARSHVIIVAAARNTSTLTDRMASTLVDGVEHIYNIDDRYSNYGPLVDIAAPGTDILSTVFESGYALDTGTSMATPMVAGAAAMVFGANPKLKANNVKNILCFSGDTLCSRNEDFYRMLNLKASVDWAKQHGQKLPEPKKPEVGFVTGMVQDAATLELIDDASVLITNEADNTAYSADVRGGYYQICLKPGTYKMEFSAEGYKTEIIYHVTVEAKVVSYNVLLNMVTDTEVTGAVYGRIVDAFDGSSIANATIKIYAGINQTTGNPVLETKSNGNGTYSATLAPGNYTLCASASGYMNGKATIICMGDRTNDDQDCTLTPRLRDGEMRVVLTWGAYPRDLDSHLRGPAPGGKRFHTYYRAMNYAKGDRLYDNLDVDDTTSYGPETTSVYIGLSGKYTFSVHDFTNRDSSHSNALATSGAEVKLYIAGREEPYVFNVPNRSGTVWKVFSVEDGTVKRINKMSYESEPDYVGR